MSKKPGSMDDLPSTCLTAGLDTTVEELIPLCMGSELPVAIRDVDGNVVGKVDRQSLMTVLASGEDA